MWINTSTPDFMQKFKTNFHLQLTKNKKSNIFEEDVICLIASWDEWHLNQNLKQYRNISNINITKIFKIPNQWLSKFWLHKTFEKSSVYICLLTICTYIYVSICNFWKEDKKRKVWKMQVRLSKIYTRLLIEIFNCPSWNYIWLNNNNYSNNNLVNGFYIWRLNFLTFWMCDVKFEFDIFYTQKFRRLVNAKF